MIETIDTVAAVALDDEHCEHETTRVTALRKEAK